MSQLTIGHLRKDISFIEKGINLTNKAKKKQAEEPQAKINKKLRYFLKKQRGITYKTAPYKQDNGSKLDGSTVIWTVQIKIEGFLLKLKDVSEEVTVGSIVSKNRLKREFLSEDFSEFITGPKGELIDEADIQIKTIRQEQEDTKDAEESLEEGEMAPAEPEAKKPQVEMKTLDRSISLKDALKGQLVLEFPTLYVKFNQ